MNDNPDAVLVGSLFSTIDAQGRELRAPDWGRLGRSSAFAPFAHPTVVMRRDAFHQVGGYRLQAKRWEDVDLYLRLAELGPVLVVTEPLMQVRISSASTRLADPREEIEREMDAMYRAVGGGTAQPGQGKLLPQAFLPVASLEVWQGLRPRVLGRLLRTGARRPVLPMVRMLVWAVWAEVSPRSLRAFLRALLAVRNARARRRLGAAAVVEWKPFRS
jgi:hypothetical protein